VSPRVVLKCPSFSHIFGLSCFDHHHSKCHDVMWSSNQLENAADGCCSTSVTRCSPPLRRTRRQPPNVQREGGPNAFPVAGDRRIAAARQGPDRYCRRPRAVLPRRRVNSHQLAQGDQNGFVTRQDAAVSGTRPRPGSEAGLGAQHPRNPVLR
jgi:hypothetical protein